MRATGLRLGNEALDRIDALITRLKDHPLAVAVGDLNRSALIRLCVFHALPQLEAEADQLEAAKKKAKAKKKAT